MPNHVYNTLYSTGKPMLMETLHEASKNLNGGLAMLLMPRPQEEEEYWYSWNLDNWGTKWGCYEQDVEGDQLHFTTAWGTISDKLLDRIAKHFPNFIFEYEEEQGWGGVITYKNGQLYQHEEYDIPEWGSESETDNGRYAYHLDSDYEKFGKTYPRGWYYDMSLEQPVESSTKILNVE